MTPFGQQVRAALDARKAAQASGPRTMRDLARATGCDPGNLHHFLRGTKPLPAATEQAIRAALPELQEGK